MFDKLMIGIIALGIIAGQLFILNNKMNPGLVLTSVSFMAAILRLFFGAFTFEKIKAVFSNNTDFIRNNEKIIRAASVIMAVIALVIAAIAAIVVKITPAAGLAFFIISGIMLFLARPFGEKPSEYYGIPEKTAPMEKWEPWFVAILLVVSAIIRFWYLNDIPQAGSGGEGLMVGGSYELDGTPDYWMHIGAGLSWPTLVFYIGLFFAKVFGWCLGSFRMSSAVLGVISIIAFYFLARRITSPYSAAIGAVMYSAMVYHMSISRLYGPFTLLFIPQVLGMGLLLAACKRPVWYIFLAAGAAAGFSLHGYVPGRGVFVLYLAWFAWMFIMRVKLFHKWYNAAIFWAGFAAVASPIIYFAITHGDQYWSYVNSVNPAGAGGLKGYWNMMMSKLAIYSGMFHIKSAWEIFAHPPWKPLLEAIPGMLFPAGLFLALINFWRPIPSMLLIFFCGGMLPAMLGGGGSNEPNAQRALMSFPIIFLMVSFAIERMKRVIKNSGFKKIYSVFLVAGIAAAGVTFWNGFDGYFFKFMQSPGVKIQGNHSQYKMKKMMDAHPDANVIINQYLTMTDGYISFLTYKKPVSVRLYMEEMLVLDPARDNVVMFSPFYANASGIFTKYFPSSVLEIEREKKENEKDPYYSTMDVTPSGWRQIEECVPFVMSAGVFIPKKDVVDFQTMLFMEKEGGNERVRVFGDPAFSAAYAGKKVVLKGALLMPENGYKENSKSMTVFTMAWPGWKMKLDGNGVALSKPVFADGGIHFFEISGVVPAANSNGLPFAAMYENRNLAAEGRVVAMEGNFGVRVYDRQGIGKWGPPYAYTHRFITPDERMYDGLSVDPPLSRRCDGYMQVPVSGEYSFECFESVKAKIVLDGELIYDSYTTNRLDVHKKVILDKNKKYRIEIYTLIEAYIWTKRIFALFVVPPGETVRQMAPYEWFTQY